MTEINKRKPAALYFLMALIFFQAISGLTGGICFLISPDGQIMQMPLNSLQHSPFKDFLIPGMILFVLLGLYPFLIFSAFLKPNLFSWLDRFNIYSDQKYVWTHSLYLGIILIVWIDVEIIFISYSVLQTFYGFLGIVILILTLSPKAKNYFKIEHRPT